jgi:hypothetical protein
MGVRFAGKSLEQLLSGLAAGLATGLRHDVDIAVVVRDRHGARVWGHHTRAALTVVKAPAGARKAAVDAALEDDRMGRDHNTLTMPIGPPGRAIGAVIVTSTGVAGIADADVDDVQRSVTEWAPTIDNAIAYAEADARAKHLESALFSRAVIEQAKGILMERERCGADGAFEILRDRSQRTDVKVAVVAQQIVAEAQR